MPRAINRPSSGRCCQVQVVERRRTRDHHHAVPDRSFGEQAKCVSPRWLFNKPAYRSNRSIGVRRGDPSVVAGWGRRLDTEQDQVALARFHVRDRLADADTEVTGTGDRVIGWREQHDGFRTLFQNVREQQPHTGGRSAVHRLVQHGTAVDDARQRMHERTMGAVDHDEGLVRRCEGGHPDQGRFQQGWASAVMPELFGHPAREVRKPAAGTSSKNDRPELSRHASQECRSLAKSVWLARTNEGLARCGEVHTSPVTFPQVSGACRWSAPERILPTLGRRTHPRRRRLNDVQPPRSSATRPVG